MLLLIIACAAIGMRLVRGVSAADAIDAGPWPGVLNTRWPIKLLALAVLGLTTGVPVYCLVHSLAGPLQPLFMWTEFSPPVLGSLLVGTIAGGAALVLAIAATSANSRAAIVFNFLTFLVGGQLLAIALIRIYNHEWLARVYDSAALADFAYLARFGWLGAGGRAIHTLAAMARVARHRSCRRRQRRASRRSRDSPACLARAGRGGAVHRHPRDHRSARDSAALPATAADAHA